MRNHGRLLLRLTTALGLTRLRDTVVAPAIADLQHERDRAESGRERGWAIARGYWSIFVGSVFYASLQPARSLREDWSSLHSAGPRLLRNALGPALIASAIFLGLGLGLTSWFGERPLDFRVVALLIPSFISSAIPVTIAIGVAWTLSRSGARGRGATGVGLITAVLSFAFFEMIVVDANQAYRQAALNAATGRNTSLSRGSREMTFSDLSLAASGVPVASCRMKSGGGCSASRQSTAEFLNTDWHNRLVLPALAIPLVLVAATLSRCRSRLIAIPGLYLTAVTTFTILHVSEAAGVRGDIPVPLAAWSAPLFALLVSFVLHIFTESRRTPAITG